MTETPFHALALNLAPGRVFTPRPATEGLVNTTLDLIQSEEHARVADIGTGTGAIALALAVARPNVEVWATDTNPAAVELARTNAERHGVADRVHVVEGDLLERVPHPVDVVVAN